MDRSITQDIDADTARRALATALVVFGAEIGATVIAEGVETQDEILALRRAGIHRAQGFALASPAPLPLVPIEYQPAGRAPVEEESPRSRVRRRLRGAVDGLSTAQAEVEDMVALARRAGIPWGEIADIVGMTRQGATKRYGRRGQHER